MYHNRVVKFLLQEKVANLFNLNMTTPYILQRITENTYWYQSGFWLFYISDKGVLLFDPLEQRAEPILKSIRSITDKPITAIVYSHDHADHISATDDLLKLLKKSPKEQLKLLHQKQQIRKWNYWEVT